MKMRGSSRIILFLALALIPLALFVSHKEVEHQTPVDGSASLRTISSPRIRIAERDKIAEAYGKLPLSFQPNVGQTAPQVKYLTHGEGYELFLTPTEAVLGLHNSARAATGSVVAHVPRSRTLENAVIRLKFDQANPAPQIDGLDRLHGRSDYFAGDDPRNWHTGVPSFSRIKYQNLYPGIDAAFHGNGRKLEYDFTVAPGANADAIAISISGARKLAVNSNGNVILSLPSGDVELAKPIAYQSVEGKRREIAANYTISSNRRVKFALGKYDDSYPLVIDPVLNYSTFLGGSSFGDSGFGIAVDAVGNAYISGTTYSLTFPNTASALNQNTPGAATTTAGAAFVTELNPTGTAELYSTYLSGDNGETGGGVAIDPVATAACGNGPNPGVCIYTTGETFSKDFPTKNAYLAGPLAADPAAGTIFLTKINPNASGANSLVYSSFLGGQNGDFGNAVAVDAAGNAYLTGYTPSPAGPASSGDFFVRGGFQTANGSTTNGNAFLIRVDTTLSGDPSLNYSTFLGGTTSVAIPGEDGNGVAVDSSNNAYVVGTTTSSDFPVTSSTAFEPAAPTGIANGAVFVTKINTATTGGGSLVYSSFLSGGTTNGDSGLAIALNPVPVGVAYVTGGTTSSFFTTAGAPTANSSAQAVFVTVVDTSKTALNSVPYSATLGGTGQQAGEAIQVDALGNIFVGGTSNAANFPTTPGAFQTVKLNTLGDAIVFELKPGGNGAADILHSTYFGGSNGASGSLVRSVALDSADNVYITGQTSDTDFPITTGAFQTGLKQSDAASTGSGFVSKLTLIPVLAFNSPCVFDFTVAPASSCALAFGSQAVGTPSAAMTFTLTNNTSADITSLTIPATGSGTNGADFAAVGTTVGANSPCTTILTAGTTCGVGVVFTPTISSSESGSLVVTYNYNNGTATAAAQSQSVELGGTGIVPAAIATISPSPLTFPGELVTTTSAAQPITVKNTGSAALNITATPSIGGTNPSDFAVASGSTCTNGASVTPGNSCVINVTFTPPANVTGTRSAVLSIADNAAGSPQTVTLSGTAWDFTVSAQPINVTAGKNGTITATVTGLGGFTGAVSLACSTNIPQGSCMTPTSVNASATGATASVTVITRGAVPAPLSPKTPPISRQQVLLAAFALVLLMSLPLARRFRTRLSLAGAAAILVVVAGCSSPLPTPAGTYTVTITGSASGLNRAATVNVTVQGN